MSTITILELEDNCFYIESSDTVYTADVFINKMEWLSKHPVVRIYGEDALDEYGSVNKLVKEFMQCYGVDSVRGGSYYRCQLSEDTVADLVFELFGFRAFTRVYTAEKPRSNKKWIRMFARNIRMRWHSITCFGY